MNDSRKKSRRPVRAAGGIVVRPGPVPLFAVVQMRKFDSWVLPKGKLHRDETAVQAAQREVMEETGHDVAVHEFVGTLAYEVGGRQKIVQFWRMQALDDEPAHELMYDVQKVQWLPLEEALGLLTYLREREFLGSVGPHVMAAMAAAANGSATARTDGDAGPAMGIAPATSAKKPWGREIVASACAFLRRIRPARAQG
jgi:8-oxo-dGTP diphosphatase